MKFLLVSFRIRLAVIGLDWILKVVWLDATKDLDNTFFIGMRIIDFNYYYSNGKWHLKTIKQE